MPEHGGRLLQASRRYGIPPADWLDLSTGINPCPWPVVAVPAEAWHRLPEPDDGLLEAAAAYYGSAALLPVAGSQAAIAALPRLRPPGRVGVLSPGYTEHAHCWSRAGHRVIPLTAEAIDAALPQLDTLVVINPCNPGGECFEPERLLAWQRLLDRRGGWLVVDEAYADCTPQLSVSRHCPLSGLVVLRSLGKFFGLAGLRVGFVLAEAPLRLALDEELGPWCVAGASRHLARAALVDSDWQAHTRRQLPRKAAQLDHELRRHGLAPLGGCPLFRRVATPMAARWADRLARQGILVRSFGEPAALRFGLPAGEAALARLGRALSSPADA